MLSTPIPTELPPLNRPIIASSFNGNPTLGPVLETGQSRALLGWTHKKDTPEGLLSGRLWCWVSEGERGFAGMFCVYIDAWDGENQTRRLTLLFLQVFDAPVNRSPFSVGTGRGPNADGGCLVDCGVANFGMVRMFHPWWCLYSHVPKDMNAADKRCCRHRYRQLIAKDERDRRQRRGRGNGDSEMFFGEGQEGSDDDVLFLNRRNAIKERRRKGLGLKMKGHGSGVGTVEKPVVLDGSDDDKRGGRRRGSERLMNGGEERRMSEKGEYGEVGDGGGEEFEVVVIVPGPKDVSGSESDPARVGSDKGDTAEMLGSESGRENDPIFVA